MSATHICEGCGDGGGVIKRAQVLVIQHVSGFDNKIFRIETCEEWYPVNVRLPITRAVVVKGIALHRPPTFRMSYLSFRL